MDTRGAPDLGRRGCSQLILTGIEEHFSDKVYRVVEGFDVEVAGYGVVSHAGSAAVRVLAGPVWQE